MSHSPNERPSRRFKQPLNLKRTLKELKDLRNKQATIAKRMEILLNEASFLADRVNVRISKRSTTKSRTGKTYEILQNKIQPLQSSTQQEYSDYSSSSDQNENVHQQFGRSGEKQEQEKQEECGTSPIWTNCGSTQGANGSTDIWDTNPLYSTTLTDPGLRSPTFSNYWTAMCSRSQLKEDSLGGLRPPSTLPPTSTLESGIQWPKKNTSVLY
nr:relication protein B [Mute swan feces associated circular virus 2]